MSNTDQNLPALIVQFILAFIMLAVAFEVTIADLKSLPNQWKKLLLGYSMQVLFLPVYIIGLLLISGPSTNLVLAFLLLAACPGGNLSQLFVVRSNGSVSLSMGMTFISTILSPLTVPGIFFLATHANSDWIEAYKSLNLEWSSIFRTLFFSLFIPLVIGMWIANKKSTGWIKFRRAIQFSVPWLLFILLSGAVWSFRTSFSQVTPSMILMVAGLSFSCLLSSYLFARFIGQDHTTSITVAWEVSIQNSGLGMVLGIIYFSHVPEVTLVGALWGIWQIFMGLVISGLIKKRIFRKEVLCQTTNAG
jgi:bile acid:Na+ symporter, BASS family